MSESTVAKISRTLRKWYKGLTERNIHILGENLAKFQNIDTDQVTLEQTTVLQSALDTAREALEKYDAAVIRCVVLEGKEEYDPDDEHWVEFGDVEDDLDKLSIKVQVLKARVREEESARATAEASVQGRQDEEPVAKPPHPMEKGFTLEEMETWSSTWEDYYQVTKLEKEIPALQRDNFNRHLSQEMCGVVEHALGIGPDSTKKLDDRFLTKIMAGLSDQENREELLASVSAHKLEEANGVRRQRGDRALIWTVFDRGKSLRESTGRNPQEAFDMTKHGTGKRRRNLRVLRPIAALLGGEKDSGVVSQTFPYDTG